MATTISFPPELPDCPQTWSEKSIDQLIRSEVDVGVAKVRRRYTRERLQITISLTLLKNQYDAFKTFYDVTLKDGLETFNYKHPYTGKILECRFLEAPQIEMNAKAFSLSMSWETI